MAADDLLTRLLPTFLGEAARHLEDLRRGSTALSGEPSSSEQQPILERCFRSAHTLKGASAALGLSSIEGACANLERSLSAMRRGTAPVTPEDLARLSASVDGIAESCRQLRDEGREAREAEARLPPQASTTPATKRAIVADDSPTARTFKQRLLESAGFAVAVAGDGQAALQLLESTGADLLVTDVEMPELDGLALTRALRGSERFRQLRILIVSGHDSAEERGHGMQAGADEYLSLDGFDPRQFLSAVARLFSTKER